MRLLFVRTMRRVPSGSTTLMRWTVMVSNLVGSPGEAKPPRRAHVTTSVSTPEYTARNFWLLKIFIDVSCPGAGRARLPESEAAVEGAHVEGQAGADHPALAVELAAGESGDREPRAQPEIELDPRLDEPGRAVVVVGEDAGAVAALDRERHVAHTAHDLGGQDRPAQAAAHSGDRPAGHVEALVGGHRWSGSLARG